jgi:hypothetical protein
LQIGGQRPDNPGLTDKPAALADTTRRRSIRILPCAGDGCETGRSTAGIKNEVYYLKEHPWNVPKMLDPVRESFKPYTANFGPYPHKEARIIEFPQIAQFAPAFPGTMPYSESIGFIANLEHPDDIDMVFYVVAHEMRH